jgi:hypothetical protein
MRAGIRHFGNETIRQYKHAVIALDERDTMRGRDRLHSPRGEPPRPWTGTTSHVAPERFEAMAVGVKSLPCSDQHVCKR